MLRLTGTPSKRILLAAIALSGTALIAQNVNPKTIQKEIKSGLTGSWKNTGFKSVDSPPAPWGDFFRGNEYLGYAAMCEDRDHTIESGGPKSGPAGASSTRHPMFVLWLFRRSAAVTPARVLRDWNKLQQSAMQKTMPTLLGY